MDTNNLFEQMANISKASAYDIIVKQRNELLEENAKLKEQNRIMKEALQEIAASKVWSMGEALQTAANALNKLNS